MSARGRMERARFLRRCVAPMIAALLAAGATPAAAEVVTLSAVRDNTLFMDATGSLSNGAGPVMFAGRNSQNLIRRALVRFDVGGSIPPGAVISSAVLTLHVSNVSDVTPRVFTLHRVQRDWGEGTSSATGGAGAPATPNDATWLHSVYPGSLWSSAGGDYEPIPDASQLLADVGSYSWSAPPMVSDVQAWCDGIVPDHGWIVVGDETVAGTARRFDTRENSVAAYRPTLTVTYSMTTGVGGGELSRRVAVGPSWPNPSSGLLRLRLSLPSSARVGLTIHDVCGRRVAVAPDRAFDAGVHDMTWEGRGLDGRKLASGLYFVTVSVDGGPAAVRSWVRLD